MKVYCSIPNQYEGFRELENFNNAVSKAWSKTGQIFPMYDIETTEIFECAFNPDFGSTVAFNPITIERFRERLEEAAKELIQARVQLAIEEASEEAARLYSSVAYAEKLHLFF